MPELKHCPSRKFVKCYATTYALFRIKNTALVKKKHCTFKENNIPRVNKTV